MGDVQGWSGTDDSNTDLFPENMPFGDVNDGGRAIQGAIARWFKDTNGSIDASGSSNAFAITSNRTIAALADDLVMAFTANHTITGAATLNLNGLGAKDIKRFNGNVLASGDIVSGQMVLVVYKQSADDWFMVSAPAALTGNSFSDFDENAAPGDPAANDARLYAKDVNSVTRLAYRDSAGLETLIGYQGELVAIIEDNQTSGTNGAALTSGADTPRTLNTLVYNRDTLVSLASNRFTLPAGTWEIEWVAPIATPVTPTDVGGHQSFLYNQSDSAEVKRGTSCFYDIGATANGPGDISQGSTVVTIASAKAFEIRHRVGTANVTQGDAAGLGTEVYTRVVIRRA